MCATVAQTIRVTTRGMLNFYLSAVTASGDGLRFTNAVPRAEGYRIDRLETYIVNCKEPRAYDDAGLPGFSTHRIRASAADSIKSFNHFCRCQFGQRKAFLFQLVRAQEDAPETTTPPSFGVVAEDFDGKIYGDEYLVVREGDRIEKLDAPCDDEGWGYGRHVETDLLGWFPPTYVS